MDETLVISSINYSGYTAQITFYPDSGGTIDLGSQVIPFEYNSEYLYGTYELYFPFFNSTCTLSYTEYLLQEDGSFLLQENGYKLIITN